MNFAKVQMEIDSKKLAGKKAKKLIYSFLKKLNKGTKIGDRNYTSQFLTNMSLSESYIEVFKGEKGLKVFRFIFRDGMGSDGRF